MGMSFSIVGRDLGWTTRASSALRRNALPWGGFRQSGRRASGSARIVRAGFSLSLTVALGAGWIQGGAFAQDAAPARDQTTPALGAPQGASDVKKVEPKLDAQAKDVQDILSGAGKAGAPQLLPTPVKPEPVVSEPAALKIVDRYLEAIGGRENLAAIRDRTVKFDNTKYSPTGEVKVSISLYQTRDYMYREEWKIHGFKIGKFDLAFAQIYNGDLDEGWVSMFGTVSALEGRTLSVFLWDKPIDDTFMSFANDGYTVHIAGEGIVDGKPADIVSLRAYQSRSETTYFFDRESGLVVKKAWVDVVTGETGKKEQYYRNYRRIAFSDGSTRSILFPLKLEILVDGDLDSDRDFTEVQFNSNLSTAIFGKPEGVPFEQRDKTLIPDEAVENLPVPVPHGTGRRRGVHSTRPTPVPEGEKPTGAPTPAPVDPKASTEAAPKEGGN
jgi:hypothetical protein